MSKLLPIYAFLLPWLSLLWSNSHYFPIQTLAFIAKIVSIIFFLTAIGHIILSSRLQKFKGRLFSAIILLMVILGGFYSFIGLINGFEEKNLADFFTFINGPLMAYAAFQSDYLCHHQKQIIKRTCDLLLFSLGCTVSILFLEGMLGIPHYPAVASSWAILPLVWFILEGKYIKVMFVLSLILFSGKRSVLGLGVIVSSIIPFWKMRFSIALSTILSVFMIIPIVLSVFIILNSLPKHNISSLNKLSFVNPFSENFNPVIAAGERIEEIEFALDAQGSRIFDILVGTGNGFTYELRVDRKNLYEKDRHNVHFTPINYYIRYGIIFTVLYYLILIGCIFRIFSRIQQREKYEQAMAFFIIYGTISSFISFGLPLNYLFWFCLGTLLRKHNE